MKPKEKHILETFKHLLEQRVHLNTFALFGSRARGDAGRNSDMDVLVVVDQLDTPTAHGSQVLVAALWLCLYLIQGQNGRALRASHFWLSTSEPMEYSCEAGRQKQHNWLSA